MVKVHPLVFLFFLPSLGFKLQTQSQCIDPASRKEYLGNSWEELREIGNSLANGEVEEVDMLVTEESRERRGLGDSNSSVDGVVVGDVSHEWGELGDSNSSAGSHSFHQKLRPHQRRDIVEVTLPTRVMRFVRKVREDDELGGGGFGTTYRVFPKASGQAERQQVCLKVSKIRRADLVAQAITPEEREVFIMQKMKHRTPLIATVFSYFYDAGQGSVFIFEEAGDADFGHVAVTHKRQGGYELLDQLKEHFQLRITAMRVMCFVLRALLVLHIHDVVHGDLTPWNILLFMPKDLNFISVPSHQVYAKLIDFGLSKSTDEVDLYPAGSLFYMPPEVLWGLKASQQAEDPFTDVNRDKSTDMWTVGVMLDVILNDNSMLPQVEKAIEEDQMEKDHNGIGFQNLSARDQHRIVRHYWTAEKEFMEKFRPSVTETQVHAAERKSHAWKRLTPRDLQRAGVTIQEVEEVKDILGKRLIGGLLTWNKNQRMSVQIAFETSKLLLDVMCLLGQEGWTTPLDDRELTAEDRQKIGDLSLPPALQRPIRPPWVPQTQKADKQRLDRLKGTFAKIKW